MSNGPDSGSRLVTRAELDRLVDRLSERFASVNARMDRADRALDALERDIKPYGDGGPDLDLDRWNCRVDRAKRGRR